MLGGWSVCGCAPFILNRVSCWFYRLRFKRSQTWNVWGSVGWDRADRGMCVFLGKGEITGELPHSQQAECAADLIQARLGGLVSFSPCLGVLLFMQMVERSCPAGSDSFPVLVSHSGQASLAKPFLSPSIPLPFGWAGMYICSVPGRTRQDFQETASELETHTGTKIPAPTPSCSSFFLSFLPPCYSDKPTPYPGNTSPSGQPLQPKTLTEGKLGRIFSEKAFLSLKINP